MKSIIAPLVAVALSTSGLGSAAFAQNADTVLLNGKIVTLDAAMPTAEALAVRDGKIVAVGTSADVRAFAGAGTRMIDLEGRTVVPGLIDSHMHAIRAALFYATEVNWIGTSSIPAAMERIKAAAQRAKPGQWIIVAGGWTEQQFREKRRPTQAELLAAAPDNPVYVQLFYSAALLTPAAYKALTSRPTRTYRRAARSSALPTGRSPAGFWATIPPSAACSTSCRCRHSTRASRARGSSSASSTALGSPA